MPSYPWPRSSGFGPSAGRRRPSPSACAGPRPWPAAAPSPGTARRCARLPVCAPRRARSAKVVDRLAPPEDLAVPADEGPVLSDDDPLGKGLDLDRASDSGGHDRVLGRQGTDPPDWFLVFLPVEPDRAGLRDRVRHTVEAVEGTGVAHQMRPLRFEHLPDDLAGLFGMPVGLGMDHALVEQPGVELVEAPDPQARDEEPLPGQPDAGLSTWPFSQPEAAVQARGWAR